MGVRLVVGAFLVGIGLAVPMTTLWQTVALVIGTVAPVTGAIRWCPLNQLLGLNSFRGRGQSSPRG